MLSPTPAASICATSTACPGAAANSSTTCWRRAGGTLPDSGPNTRPPPGPGAASRESFTTPRTCRKLENTTTFSPFSAASSTISRSRFSFADLSGCAYAALRIAMKLPERTASR